MSRMRIFGLMLVAAFMGIAGGSAQAQQSGPP
jgi:hypothetical protein